VAVVYNGTDAEIFRPLEHEKETDLIFIGRTEDRKKGIPYLLDALAQTPEHVTLKIVDGRIPKDGLVPRKLRELGLEKRVVLVERMLSVEELVEQYSTARIAVVPSFFEGFGFPASEAMACGRPVIASDLPTGVRFVNKNQMTGLLVPPGNSDALAAALQRLLGDERLRQTLGNAAKRRAELEFSSDRMVRRVQQVYEEVLGGRR
jgi:glycosyltransferase involved in cell wall biosynthesis